MLETLTAPAPDKIIELIGIYAADGRTGKVDLGIGVYKDAEGRTPIMRAVKAAERRLVEEQDTKAYLGVTGDRSFVAGLRDVIFADALDAARIGGAQTPGGTGAVRQLCELILRARPEARVWYSDPTWPNHPAILNYLEMPSGTYRYYDAAAGAVDFAAMQSDLAAARAGDVVILHGCCHNPTGADLSLEQWQALTRDFAARGIVPMIDLAYQGFGDGLEADAEGVRHMAASLPETLLAASCSKNFGFYRDRVGAVLRGGRDARTGADRRGQSRCAQPAELLLPARSWRQGRVDDPFGPGARRRLEGRTGGDAPEHADPAPGPRRRAAPRDQFRPLRLHRRASRHVHPARRHAGEGQALRDEHGIYMVGTGRINIAGLPKDGLDRLAQAIAAVGI